jgi:pimeloyl-ACP methyl ester carboxylesterase
MPLSRSVIAGCLAASLIVAACGGEPVPTPAPPATPGATASPGPTPSPTPLPAAILDPSMSAAELFDDQTTADELGLVEQSREPRDGAVIRDVRFSGADGAAVAAYIVAPADADPTAGVVFLHWLGDDFSSREEFVEEAVGLAANGVESILINQVFPWSNRPAGVDHDRVAIGLQVRTIRRAITLLAADVGTGRIGLVGHDYGAMHGILAASVNDRLGALACMAPDATWVNWFVTYFHLADDGYAQAMADVDPVTRIAGVEAPVLLQFGTADAYVSGAAAGALTGAAPAGTVVHRYNAGHRLDSQAGLDRDAWILDELGIETPAST